MKLTKSICLTPQSLRLRTPRGDVVEVPASNYYLEGSGNVRPSVAPIANTVLDRTAAAQAELGRIFTSEHARHEMSFRVKNPDTRADDHIFKVPTHAAPIPISESHFRLLVRST